MTPVFSNTAWVSTRERLVRRGGGWHRVRLPVRVGILERPDGPALIDAGYSHEALSAPGRSMGLRLYGHLLGPKLRPTGDPEAALAQLGYSAKDVTAVIVTHFHVDHVSALARFPNARLLAHGPSLKATLQRSYLANMRHGVFAELLPQDAPERLEDVTERPLCDAPLGLGPAHDLFGDGAVLAVPLPGHAEGQLGLCFTQGARPLLYAVDVQWLLASLPNRLPGPPASLVAHDRRAAEQSVRRVSDFIAQGGEVMLCHDPTPTPRDLSWG